jgi:MurNAc alpha-1-phosphate uridylyltransferase
MTRAVVVLAGGLGTRVAHVTGPDLPKALLPIGGHPFIDFKLAELTAEGADEIVLLVGHNADALEQHLREAAIPGGVRVRCVEDGPALLGTGGAIRRALDDLPARFWITYGDTLLDVPMEAVERFADDSGVNGVMVVLENVDQWETSNVSVGDGRVAVYEKGAPPGTHRFIDYGMLLLTRDAFAGRPVDEPFDLGEILHQEIAGSRLGAWTAQERFHDIGTEAAWRETDAWVQERAHWDRLQERIERRAETRDLPGP